MEDDRTEALYISDEHRLFLLINPPGEKGPRVRISVLPFNVLGEETREEMRKSATPWSPENNGGIAIEVGKNIMTLRDEVTGIRSTAALRTFESDFKGVKEMPYVFEKYVSPSVKTAQPVVVGKPLAFRRNAP